MTYGIVPAIGKHVIAEEALAGGDEGVGVDKSADGGVVITALQVIEAGILGGVLANAPFLSNHPWFSEKRKPGAFCVVVIWE